MARFRGTKSPSSSARPSNPSFRSVSKRFFMKKGLGSVFGGPYKNSMNPLTRKDVRAHLDRAGVLAMFDPTVKGKHGSSRKNFTRKEAEMITKETRRAAREMRKEGIKGPFESGALSGSADTRVVKKAMEEEFAEQLADQNGAKDVLRERAARRRELVRREMGLAANEKVVQNSESRREKYQKKIEHEIEQIVAPNKTGVGVAKAPSSSAGAASHIAGALQIGQSAHPAGVDLPILIPKEEDGTQSDTPRKDEVNMPANVPATDAKAVFTDSDTKKADEEDDSEELPDLSRINDNLPL